MNKSISYFIDEPNNNLFLPTFKNSLDRASEGKAEGTLQEGIAMASEGQCFDNDSVLL